MIGLELRFLAGRFHGNGWHHAHNEGIPEWPPSPWRVLRALVSAAYAEDAPAVEAQPLLEKLRGLPRYLLPLAAEAHTRYYMPDADDANEEKTKVFDAFVAVEGGANDPRPVTIGWPVDLSTDERALLTRLCRRVSYLGRAESWVDLTVVDADVDQWDCWPDERDQTAGATSLLALLPVEDFAAWIKDQPVPKKGRDVPRTVWDVLTFDGARYRGEGWSAVPGTRLARYVFRQAPFRRASVHAVSRRRAELPTVARFAIRSAVLPRLHEALAVGERLRVSAMSQSKRVSGQPRPVFSGHGDGVSNHRHAMYLSSSDTPKNAERGFIDHLTISASAGFDEQDVIALQSLRRLWGRAGHDLELILVGLGRPADFGGLTPPQSPILASSRIWQSVTPFIPTRHPKKVRAVDTDTIADQLRRGCAQLLNGVEPVEVMSIGDRAKWARFRRRRASGGGRRGPDWALGARLVFAQPIAGPIALGYGCHFGLGLFAPVRDPIP